MATFVLNPPTNVDVVSFFVTARLAGQSNSEAFTDALIDQLTALLGEKPAADLSAAARDAHRRGLLAAAARRARQTRRTLVLVVDGLDEDSGTISGSGIASIASLLPRHPQDGLKVIVAGRPNPPIPDDVPYAHPLRTCRSWMLEDSTVASEIQWLARAELDALLGGDTLARDVVGLVAAADEAISVDKLIDVTGRAPWELSEVLNGTAGRTLMVRSEGAAVSFAHEKLLVTTRARLGSRLVDEYRKRLTG